NKHFTLDQYIKQCDHNVKMLHEIWNPDANKGESIPHAVYSLRLIGLIQKSCLDAPTVKHNAVRKIADDFAKADVGEDLKGL
ncbi:hypothetical protein PENTCL1PPCAC_10267, partial [Pristionchus entomophagus]